MKKLILLSAVLFCGATYGQKLVLTPNGLRDSLNTEKSYVILNIEGKSAKQLYDHAVKYINKSHANPKEAIKGQADGEYLKYQTHVPGAISFKNCFLKERYDKNYTIELNFKDGKVKFEIIDLDMTQRTQIHMNKRTTTGVNRLMVVGNSMNLGIFTSDGDLKRADAKAQIEKYFNNQISQLVYALSGNSKIADNW